MYPASQLQGDFSYDFCIQLLTECASKALGLLPHRPDISCWTLAGNRIRNRVKHFYRTGAGFAVNCWG